MVLVSFLFPGLRGSLNGLNFFSRRGPSDGDQIHHETTGVCFRLANRSSIATANKQCWKGIKEYPSNQTYTENDAIILVLSNVLSSSDDMLINSGIERRCLFGSDCKDFDSWLP
ncbi:hypothetical protein NE237_029979 [Protea cynaroides]|uniref:Uncharacterized protein n=1 Tax=Protea cynaroides TaxID=273540 RepID=A0A9Q0JVL6_9MAGN|nr:hypothetical protein NE237_029979 [Protea cynaroides]